MDHNKVALIQQMKRMMQQRPQDVSEADWASVQVNGPEEALTGAMEALKGQLVEGLVSNSIKGLPADNKAKIQSLFNLGLHELLKVMADPKTKDSVRMQAAQFLMEHDVGKAKQEVEHSGSLALEIRAQAKQVIESRKASMREVGPKEKVDKQPTAIDTFIKTHVPDGFVVGKKATADGKTE